MQGYFRKTIKMSIQLLIISHKTARASLRGRFVFDSEQTKDILKQLTEPDGQQENTGIEEAVLISTCNPHGALLQRNTGKSEFYQNAACSFSGGGH